MTDHRELKQLKKKWRGRLVKHLDSVAHLKIRRHSLFKIKAIAQRSLESSSEVMVTEVAHISDFLRTCEYVSDPDLHGVDEKMCPADIFEKQRKGDCEEFAFWTWKMLVHLGFNARFTMGKLRGTGHAWVTLFDTQKNALIVEATALRTAAMPSCIIPDQFAVKYQPRLSIDRELRMFQHL